jgi:hypothetical protein
MSKEDRKQLVLEFLRDTETALPRTAIYRNIRLRGATFRSRATKDYLDELVEEDRLLKVDPERLEYREIVEIPPSETGYYLLPDVAVKFGDVDDADVAE